MTIRSDLLQPRPWAQVFYLLDGVIYRWSGWCGCQLESIEWRRPPAGTQRVLTIDFERFEFTVFNTSRHGLKIRSTWALSHGGSLDEQDARIFHLQTTLRKIA
jgi:hypothetical protein